MREDERSVAVEAVLRAATLCESVRREIQAPAALAKDDRSPVTVADFGAQAVVILALRAAFPGAPVVAEESAGLLRTAEGAAIRDRVLRHVRAVVPGARDEEILDAIDHGTHPGGPHGRFWTLDPIDGTKGFLRNEQYAVALALVEEGRVVLGVLGCPNLPHDASHPQAGRGCLFAARAGEGATVRPLADPREGRIEVSALADPTRAVFCESVESGHSSHGDAARVAGILGVTAPPYRIDSQCKYAAVARGDAAIYLRLPTKKEYREKVWDHAAGWSVVTEAGGRVTDVDGRGLDFSRGRTLEGNAGVIVTNGPFHDEVVAAVRVVLGR